MCKDRTSHHRRRESNDAALLSSAAMNKIAVLGSAVVGETLANGFLKHGYSAMRGSREPAKLDAWKKGAKGEAAIGTFAEAAKWGDAAVLAVKGSASEAVITEIAPHVAGKLVHDSTNPIVDQPQPNDLIHYFKRD